MRKELILKGKKYTVVTNFKNVDKLRNTFNKLTESTYGFNFEDWYSKGYWSENNRPYSLINEDDEIVSNVSVNIIKFLVSGNERIYVQIGTVMTLKDYRGNGFSRLLIEIVLDEWKNKSDMIYLFANDSVVEFYPKFNFRKCNEYEYSLDLNAIQSDLVTLKRLNIKNDSDREFVYDKVCKSIPQYNISMSNYPSLNMFYFINFMSDKIYYIEEFDALIICEFEEDIIYVHDIYSVNELDLEYIIKSLPRQNQKRVILGFTPNKITEYKIEILNEKDSILFIYNIEDNIFETEKYRFPILSHT